MSDIGSITTAIDESLPAIARQVIRGNLDPCNSDTASFAAAPDAREQHQARWHQWGILTHTRVFLRQYDEEIPELLRRWQVASAANALLDRTVEGVTKRQLLRVAILLHDVGKFAARTRGPASFHFGNHEKRSGEIIRNQLELERYGLTAAQVEYVAMTAEDHFVLGLVRKQARENGIFNIAFTESDAFATLAKRIKKDHSEDFCEIGILFLGDSLSKVDLETGPEAAVSQHETNLAIARRYMHAALASTGDTAGWSEATGQDPT